MASALVLALSACDNTPPTFNVLPHVGFEVGSQIGPSDHLNEDEEDDFTTPVYRHLYWNAIDAPGCQIRYDVHEVLGGAEPWELMKNDPRTDLSVWHQDYDGSFGGGSFVVKGWTVAARDCSGNVQEATKRLTTDVYQETGRSSYADVPGEPPSYKLPLTWTGSWATQTGTWASGGQQKFTSGRNASVSFHYDFDDEQYFGLVMAKGPGRGSAAIYVDNVRVGTVDTHAAANDNRRIVFSKQMTGGVHTVKIVNLATAGHPRIDLDAVLI